MVQDVNGAFLASHSDQIGKKKILSHKLGSEMDQRLFITLPIKFHTVLLAQHEV